MFETNFYGKVIEHDEDVVQVEQTPTILPSQPTPVGEGPPSWRHITPEQKLLSSEVLDISGNNGLVARHRGETSGRTATTALCNER